MLILEYRCKNCKDLLFVGKLTDGTKVEIMCKKTIRRESHEESNKPKWKKCRTVNTFKVGG